MSTPTKPTPEKTCEACGATFQRRRYGKRLEDFSVYMRRRFCSQSCGNTKPQVTKDAHHWRARKHRDGSCMTCGTTEALHVHHKDRDHANNEPSNLVTLCASCHLRLHWQEDRHARMDAARRAQDTARIRGAYMRPRSADGRFSSADPAPPPPNQGATVGTA